MLGLADNFSERGRLGERDLFEFSEGPRPVESGGRPSRPVILWSRCTDCSLCVDICALLVFQLQGEDVVIAQADACNGCGVCVEICPVEAISITDEGGVPQWRRPMPNSTLR